MANKINNAIYSELFNEPSNENKRMVSIVEAAISNYASVGIEKTTYERIAKHCKISRPLVVHYFKDKEEIFDMSIRYIRANYQQFALEWPDHFPTHFTTLCLLFYRSSTHEKYKKINTEFAVMGHDRITEMINQGIKEGVVSVDDPIASAKNIQIIITGAIFSYQVENSSEPLNKSRENIIKLCFETLNFKA
jgi:AcrR family transcriptional regulator